MKEIEKKDRANATKLFLTSEFWIKYFKPNIEEEIRINSNIKRIDETDIEKSYLKTKIKVDIYSGILYKIGSWVKGGKND